MSIKGVYRRNKGPRSTDYSKKMRDLSHLEEGQVVSIIPAGDSLVTGDKKDFNRPGQKGRCEFLILGLTEFVQEVSPGILGSVSEMPLGHR